MSSVTCRARLKKPNEARLQATCRPTTASYRERLVCLHGSCPADNGLDLRTAAEENFFAGPLKVFPEEQKVLRPVANSRRLLSNGSRDACCINASLQRQQPKSLTVTHRWTLQDELRRNLKDAHSAVVHPSVRPSQYDGLCSRSLQQERLIMIVVFVAA